MWSSGGSRLIKRSVFCTIVLNLQRQFTTFLHDGKASCGDENRACIRLWSCSSELQYRRYDIAVEKHDLPRI